VVQNIGKGLKEARERAGLTQNALARRARMTASQVSQVESGKRVDPQFSTVVRLAVALGVSLDEIAALSGFEIAFGRQVSVSRDPLAETEATLISIQRSLSSLQRKVASALNSLPTMKRKR
jgi:transcriptional regulator with XRE-family HTH domain